MVPIEDIQKIKTINIKNFLEQSEKFTFKKENKDYYRCEQHSSMVINTNSNLYIWYSQNQKGDIINWAMNNITNGNFVEAVKYLSGENYNEYITNNLAEISKKSTGLDDNTPLDIKFSKSMKNTFAYLNKTRYIDNAIINKFVKEHLIKQDERGNIVFLHLNEQGEIVGADLNGTNTYKRFKGIVGNSNPNYGWSIKVGEEVKEIFVFEAPIDLISYYQLFLNEIDNVLLLSISGCEKIKVIKTYLNMHKSIEVIKVSVDNDKAGNHCLNNIISMYSDFCIIDNREALKANNLKDFNELLAKEKSKL
ncbi:LtrC-like protein [Clostridium sp. DL-VIII]|uniref:DUF3991 and TOPRIM domain-containing protein n=1 Tax=Clostridium sp. DL-VIII TaxID=641107 RepID=UPI00023B0516|nr:DUF3991 and TOPRIM domain-containing protein [Clostridium sp. DL-VIII]EHJ01962.1 LtrC-like protein [Clostridium sp. DL-VIII]